MTIKIKRLHRKILLLDWAATMRDAPFKWGETDCTTLAIEAIDIQLGTDHLSRFKGAWNSALSAARFARRHLSLTQGLQNLGAMKTDAPDVGDILIGRQSPWEAVHVCLGRYSLTAKPQGTVVMVPTAVLAADVSVTAWNLDTCRR